MPHGPLSPVLCNTSSSWIKQHAGRYAVSLKCVIEHPRPIILLHSTPSLRDGPQLGFGMLLKREVTSWIMQSFLRGASGVQREDYLNTPLFNAIMCASHYSVHTVEQETLQRWVEEDLSSKQLSVVVPKDVQIETGGTDDLSDGSPVFITLNDMDDTVPGATNMQRPAQRDSKRMRWVEYMGIDVEELHNDVRVNGCRRKVADIRLIFADPSLCKYCAIIFDNWDEAVAFTAMGRGLVSPYHVDFKSMQRNDGCAVCNKALAINYQALKLTAPARRRDSDAYGIMQLSRRNLSPAATFELVVCFDFPYCEVAMTIDCDAEFNRLCASTIPQGQSHSLQLGCLKDSTSLVHHWLRSCISSHTTCQQSTMRLPSRLINIENSRARLCITNELSAGNVCYMTLSHCWGGIEMFKLLTSNYEELKSNIPIESLCRTFRDALKITQELGFNYLWIDSLCIIQDSEPDWQHEAGRMADVYGFSSLTIAATAALNGTIGCVRRGNLAYTLQTPVEVCQNGEPRTFYLSDRDIYSRTIDPAPLSRRGWCLQERLLSPRTLHFAELQLFWECDEMLACETFPQGQSSLDRGRMRRTAPMTSQLWEAIVQTYSNTSLTYTSDKVVAIAGIARRFSNGTKGEYVAGLWRDWLIDHLMWGVQYIERARQRTRPRAGALFPSWSWTSLDAPIGFNMYDPHTSVIRYINITDIDVVHAAEDPFGDVKEARLILDVRYVLKAEVKSPGIINRANRITAYLQKHNARIEIEPDIPTEWDTITSCVIIPVWRKIRHADDYIDYACLVCNAVVDSRGLFRRVGTCRVADGHEYSVNSTSWRGLFDESVHQLPQPSTKHYSTRYTDDQGLTWYRVILE